MKLLLILLFLPHLLLAQESIIGTASFYHTKFNGRKTATGEKFHNDNLTAASNRFKLGTYVRVTNLSNKKTVVVKVNDRMHPKMKRVIDLTYTAANQLDFIAKGTTKVKVEIVSKDDFIEKKESEPIEKEVKKHRKKVTKSANKKPKPIHKKVVQNSAQ